MVYINIKIAINLLFYAKTSGIYLKVFLCQRVAKIYATAVAVSAEA